jgi:hypothetical protein
LVCLSVTLRRVIAREDDWDSALSSTPVEGQMRKHDALFVLTLVILSTRTELGVLGSGVLLAADNKCITEPNLQSSQASHWFYHTDRVTHRKCWYMGSPGMKVPEVTPTQAHSSPMLKSASRITRVDVGRLNNGQVSHQSETRLDEAARDALFQDFLQWQERQKQSGLPSADRDALFREFVLWQVQRADTER